MMPPPWVSEYIGLPFLVRGRTREGCDCWGLVRLVLEERYGLVLPLFDGYETHRDLRGLSRLADLSKALLGAPRIESPEEGAVVMMTVHSHPCHVGLCVSSEHVLHVEAGADSIWERLDSSRIAPRIEGFYRVH